MKSRTLCAMCFLICATGLGSIASLAAQTLSTIETRLREADLDLLAQEARRRGDPARGAMVFYTSAAACTGCHATDAEASPLGPDLAKLDTIVSDRYIIEALLYPSRAIRKGYETVQVVTQDGQLLSGLVAREDERELVLRDATNLEQEIKVAKDQIDQRRVSDKSMMPDGLVAALESERAFLDLASYLMEVAQGGPIRAASLKPSAEQLVVKDDTRNLDHAGILRKLKADRELKAGRVIYQGHCISCHGSDGNTPALATARAFGTQKLKFGADPYSMFMTLSQGKGLMAATTHLSPKERYQVVEYIRQEFMEGSNPDFQPITNAYLASLPKGSEPGDFKPAGDRDYGPALASQLGPDVVSALTIQLGGQAIAYDLHTLDQVAVWRGGFLDLDQTQHQRGRGEGYPQPAGKKLDGLDGWQWAHQGSLDYSLQLKPARGPLPEELLDYKGHYLYQDQIVLSYTIDGREILERPTAIVGLDGVRHTLHIAPGEPLLLAAARGSDDGQGKPVEGVMSIEGALPVSPTGLATQTIALSGQMTAGALGEFTAARALGDTAGLTWSVDESQRLVLSIPADTRARVIEVVCFAGAGNLDLSKLQAVSASGDDPSRMLSGGQLRWPDVLKTVGYLGFEQGAYAVDTLSVPDTTPWNTWFRTSAIDFFPDGRMVVATVGGDIWIVSGVDDKLLDLRWKRFAGGMYEPFGVKVVDGSIYVTCKDRLTRLHDKNGDGEADYYENFSGDTDVSSFFHAFNFDLHTDSHGNFYYAKCGQYTSYALPGAIIKVSPDGKERSVVCTGFRTPNGMGILPDDRLTVSDNQGNWMPASKISLVKPGGFYGYVQTKTGGAWAPDGGKIDHTQVIPPPTYDPPLIWMPQDVDNSSGGQVWVDDPRWGPLSGRLLHTSFGKGWLFYAMLQNVRGIEQAAIVKLPHDFCTGIMRGRVNPLDGQVYVVGLNGWNENGRLGLRDSGIQRVRYTGKPLRMLADCQVLADRLQLKFNFPLDQASAADLASYVGEQWNYRWTGAYGSEMYHPVTGQVGTQTLEFTHATISEDGQTVELLLPQLQPVNQLRLRVALKDQAGHDFSEEIYWTINAVPDNR